MHLSSSSMSERSAAEKMEMCPCLLRSFCLIPHYPLPLISASSCLPAAADTWVSLHPKRARPLWSWTCGRRSTSTAATSTSWPRSWLTSANRKPWYSWCRTASANPELGTEDTANVQEQEGKKKEEEQQETRSSAVPMSLFPPSL